MKKVLSTILAVIMVASLCLSFTVLASDQSQSQISFTDQTGFASQAVTVSMNIDQTMDLSGANLKIKYDPRLELLSVSNGSFFQNIASSAIAGQKLDGTPGEYTYIGFSNGENLNKMKGTLATFTFKLPDDARTGEKFQIEIVSKSSSLITGIDGTKPFTATKGTITVDNYVSSCQEHAFPDYTIVSGVADYIKNAYKYRICTECSYAQVEKESATEVAQLFTYDGVCVNYTGKPSGIAPVFTVDANRLSFVATNIASKQANSTVDAGILVLRNGEYYTEEILYGASTTISISENNKVFVKVTDVSVFDKFEFKAFIRITDKNTHEQRYVFLNATYNGSEKISILDVVNGLNVSLYDNESQAYLNKVISGLAN